MFFVLHIVLWKLQLDGLARLEENFSRLEMKTFY